MVALLGCPQSDCIRVERGKPQLSTDEVDFSELAPGASSTQTVTVTNVGDDILAVTELRIGTETPDFTFSWNVAGIDCATEVPEEAWYVDTGYFGPADTSPSAPPSGFWLRAGCNLDVQVTYTATTPGEVQDALILSKIGELDPDWPPAWTAASYQKVVWLRGTTEGVNPSSEPTIIGRVIDVDNVAVHPGEPTGFRVRMTDPEGGGITYQWGSDTPAPPFDDATAAETHASFDPELICDEAAGEWGGGKAYHVYVIAFDVEGHQVWADATVALYPPHL